MDSHGDLNDRVGRARKNMRIVYEVTSDGPLRNISRDFDADTDIDNIDGKLLTPKNHRRCTAARTRAVPRFSVNGSVGSEDGCDASPVFSRAQYVSLPWRLSVSSGSNGS